MMSDHTFCHGVAVATDEVIRAAAGAVEHRHGTEAGETAMTVGTSVANLGNAAFNAVSVHSAGVLDLAAEAVAHCWEGHVVGRRGVASGCAVA